MSSHQWEEGSRPPKPPYISSEVTACLYNVSYLHAVTRKKKERERERRGV
jgi:hypothetical protein